MDGPRRNRYFGVLHSTLDQEETNHLNSPITIKEIK